MGLTCPHQSDTRDLTDMTLEVEVVEIRPRFQTAEIVKFVSLDSGPTLHFTVKSEDLC